MPLQFGNFLLLSTLGTGGFGAVYKAIDLPLNRYIALKILRKKLASNPQYIESFSHEARATASINHSNVAQVYSFGEQEGQYYLAMELLGGGSLDDRVSRVGKLTEKEVLEIGTQIASALRAAQQRGLLHRDVKPGNILLGDDNVPKIVDFGLARAQSPISETQEEQQSGPIWGTPYYVAPEKLHGQPEDLRSDIYSLGATLFHALAGQPLFDSATAVDFAARDAVQPISLLKTRAPQISGAAAHLIGRMLAKNPEARYQSYDELIHDFREAQAPEKMAGSTPTIITGSSRRFATILILTAVGALIACGALAWFLWVIRQKLFGQ